MFEQNGGCLKGRHLVGDPVDVVTGANTDVKFDFELPGPLPLRWRRYYSSARNTVACPLGWGHSHELDHTIDRDLDGLIYVDPLGTVVEFPELNEDGEEAIAGGFLLRRLAARLFEIEQSDGPTRVFKIPAAGPAQLVALRQDEHAIKLQRSVTGRLEWIIDSRGVRTRVATDHAGRVTGLYLNEHADKRRELPLMLYRYDEAGNLVQARDGHGATLRFQYDPNNRMTRWTDRLGYSFHFEYDAEGRCVHTFGDDGLLEVFLEYYPAQKCTIVRHADGGVWTYYYNDVGSLTEIRAPDCGATRFNFDESGRVIEEVDPNGNVTKLLYDELGRHSLRVDPLGYVHPPAEGEPDRYDPSEYTLPKTPLEWEYGKLLDPAQISAPPQDEPSLDHLVFTSNGNGNGHKPRERRKFDFNRNLIEHQDRDGVVYRSTYKSWNLPHEWIDHHGGRTVMEYASDAQLTRLADAGGTISEYNYDAKKRLVEVRRQGQVQDRYAYDEADNLIEKRDEDCRLLLRFEIGRGNLSKARHLSSGGTHEFRHDAYGRIISAWTPAGETTCSYDEDGQLLSDELDGLGVVHRFELGLIGESVYLDKFAVRYHQEEDGTLLIVDPTGGEHRVRLDGFGQVSLILENGTTLESRYDDEGRCLARTRSGGSNDAAWSRTFEYSAEGDLLTAIDSIKGTTRYEHSGHRLVGEIQPDRTRHDYRYDAAGNLLEQPGLAGVRIVEANRLAIASGDQFFYNNRGHVARRQSWCGETIYEYDSLDMLTRCVIDGQEWTAAYDAFCRRICKTWQGRTTRYYWDDFRLSSEIRHDGTVRLYLYVDEAALVPFLFIEYDGLDADPASGRRYHVFTNQVGAPVRVEDEHGAVAWSAEISPYGQAHVAEGSRIDLSLRFPGHYHDPELDLHYNRFRYYSPELGRYIQSDPLGIAGGINLYAYAPEPTTTVDIDGLDPCGPGSQGGGPIRTNPKKSGNSKQSATPYLRTRPRRAAAVKAENKIKEMTPQLRDFKPSRNKHVTYGKDPNVEGKAPFKADNSQHSKALDDIYNSVTRKQMSNKLTDEIIPPRESFIGPYNYYQAGRDKYSRTNQEADEWGLMNFGVSRNHRLADSSIQNIVLQAFRTAVTGGTGTAVADHPELIRFFKSVVGDDKSINELQSRLSNAITNYNKDDPRNSEAKRNLENLINQLSNNPHNVRPGDSRINLLILNSLDPDFKYDASGNRSHSSETQSVINAVHGLAHQARLITPGLAEATTTPAQLAQLGKDVTLSSTDHRQRNEVHQIMNGLEQKNEPPPKSPSLASPQSLSGDMPIVAGPSSSKKEEQTPETVPATDRNSMDWEPDWEPTADDPKGKKRKLG